MLRELESIRQIKGEPERRWCRDDFFDLIVWTDESGTPTRFPLCYDIVAFFFELRRRMKQVI